MEARRSRHLDWDGCFNVRDLGGLGAGDGRKTRWGALVRADSLSELTADGWDTLSADGIRTVIDLRNADERGNDATARPASISTVQVPLDVAEDREFWGEWGSGPQFGTPLYYGPHLRRFPERNAVVISEIARAEPGGVAFHCVGGRDRSGQVALLVLALVGVAAEDIAADYELSARRLRALYEARGEDDQGPALEAFLTARGTPAAAVIAETLASFDIGGHLRGGGLPDDDLRALRDRFLDS